MLKKHFATYLLATVCIISFAAAPASAGGQTAPACSNASTAAVAASSLKLLDLFAGHEEAFSQILDRISASKAATVSSGEYKQMMFLYLQEMALADISDIAPGCLTPYLASAATLMTATPSFFVMFLVELLEENAECAFMYGNWCASSVFFSMANWTQYRICAEENAAAPDQDAIANLQSDLLAMQTGALISLGLGSFYNVKCDDRIELFDFNDR